MHRGQKERQGSYSSRRSEPFFFVFDCESSPFVFFSLSRRRRGVGESGAESEEEQQQQTRGRKRRADRNSTSSLARHTRPSSNPIHHASNDIYLSPALQRGIEIGHAESRAVSIAHASDDDDDDEIDRAGHDRGQPGISLPSRS